MRRKRSQVKLAGDSDLNGSSQASTLVVSCSGIFGIFDLNWQNAQEAIRYGIDAILQREGRSTQARGEVIVAMRAIRSDWLRDGNGTGYANRFGVPGEIGRSVINGVGASRLHSENTC